MLPSLKLFWADAAELQKKVDKLQAVTGYSLDDLYNGIVAGKLEIKETELPALLRSDLVKLLETLPDAPVSASCGGFLMWDLQTAQLQTPETEPPFIDLVFREGWYP